MMKKNKKKKFVNKTSIESSKENPYGVWILLGIIIIIVTIIRIRLLSIPLERDEGEYSYMGQLILQGIPPYKIAFNMKFPGTYYVYALFMLIFGQSVTGIHLGLLIINLISILLLFLLVKKLINNYAALISSVTFAILSLNYSILGFAAHATHFVNLFALAGALFLYKATTENKNKYYLLSGILLGFAPIMKQPGIFFCLFGGLFLTIIFFITGKLEIKEHIKKQLLFLLGLLIPFITMVIIIKSYGVFNKFWYWTIEYALTYENQTQLTDGLNLFIVAMKSLLNGFYLIWIFAGIGLIILFIHPKLKNNNRRLFILLFFIFSFLNICPGLYFRPHYFVTFLPIIAILFSIFFDYLRELSENNKKLKLLKFAGNIFFFTSIAIGIASQFDYYFNLSPNEISKQLYTINPFIESIPIAQYINTHSTSKDKIAILGSEPQIYFYANRHSASGYIYIYSLMEHQKNSLQMQKEMITEIESALPLYLIYVHIPTSWHMTPYSETYIMKWTYPFLRKNNYQLMGIVDIYSNKTIFKWENEIENYKAKSENYVLIFRKQ